MRESAKMRKSSKMEESAGMRKSSKMGERGASFIPSCNLVLKASVKSRADMVCKVCVRKSSAAEAEARTIEKTY